MENILEVKNIGKKYQNKEGEILALKNVNFRVKKGEFVSIIGPSGCGKSTLLSIIAGLEEKTTGEIYIEGEKVNGISLDSPVPHIRADRAYEACIGGKPISE